MTRYVNGRLDTSRRIETQCCALCTHGKYATPLGGNQRVIDCEYGFVMGLSCAESFQTICDDFVAQETTNQCK